MKASSSGIRYSIGGRCEGSGMQRIGFIDLKSKDSGDILIFKGSPGRYEFERSFEFLKNGVSTLPGNAGVSDFYLSLPLELLNFRIVKLPFSDKEKLKKVIPFELESLTLESSENVVFDALVLNSLGDSFEVLVAYIEKDILRNILAKLSSLRIDPEVVTSLELHAIAGGPKEDIASRLVSPESLDRDKRVAAARDELSGHTINLRTGPFAYTKHVEKTKKNLRVTVALSLALVLLIHAYLAFGIITAKRETASVKKELRTVYGGLFPEDKKITDELYQMKSHMKEMKEKGDTLIGIYPLRFLLDVSQKMVQGAAFSEISLDRDLITLKGEANSMSEIDAIKKKLAEFLMDVSVSDIKPSVSGKSFFTVIAKGYKTGERK